MASDFVIIANPVSGGRGAPAMATRVEYLLRGAGNSVELRVTAARGDAFRLAAEAVAQGAATVVGCGGDGTLQEIATALDSTAAVMGVLPGGRCNDFARALGLLKTDTPEKFVHALLHGRCQRLDLGAMGAKRFLTVATLGFDSEVSRFVETRKLWLKGTPAYVYGVARVLARYRAPLIRMKFTAAPAALGEDLPQAAPPPYESRVLLVATGNAPSYGGAMRIAPDAKMDDGLFHLCIVNEVSALTVLRILPRVFKGTHVSHPAVKMLSAGAVDIETPEGPQWVCADGETLGQTPCRLEVRPGALAVWGP